MLPDNHFFFFDFTLDHTQIKAGTAFEPIPDECKKSVVLDTTNLCPYKIPDVKEIIKLVNQASHRVNPNKFLSDTFECGAIAVSNQFDFPKAEQREEHYKQIMNAYEPKERELMAEAFAKIYALLSSVVYDDGKFNDWLGELFMQTGIGNKHNGQFFTPYHISSFCAKASIDESVVRQNQQDNEIITINDPTCGAGGMLVAALETLDRDYHFNYAYNCFMLGEDIDIRCVHMTYLQLSLAGVPAIVKHTNSLTRETWDVWKTPAFLMQYMRFRQFENYA